MSTPETLEEARLLDRDEAILADLYTSGLLSTGYIANEYFKGSGAAKGRLYMLWSMKLVTSYSPQPGLKLWQLTPKGLQRQSEKSGQRDGDRKGGEN